MNKAQFEKRVQTLHEELAELKKGVKDLRQSTDLHTQVVSDFVKETKDFQNSKETDKS
jgi:hypothetical protein